MEKKEKEKPFRPLPLRERSAPMASEDERDAEVESQLLEYQYDGDTGGVFHYIGTSGGTEPWAMPALEVTRSSRGAGLPIDLLSIKSVHTHETDAHGDDLGWWCIDLGEDRRLRCAHYALRHGRAVSADRMRYWKMEASVVGGEDDANWWTLREHVDDRSFGRSQSRWCSFAILADPEFASRPTTAERGGRTGSARSPTRKSFAPAAAAAKPKPARWARYFRLRLTRPRRNSDRNLVLSRLELYGEMIAPSEFIAAGGATRRVKLLRSVGDGLRAADADIADFTSGVLYAIGTKFGKKKWHHPSRILGSAVIGTLSSLGRGAVATILARAPREKAAVCSTTQKAGLGIFTLDLGPTLRLLPTHYAMRHGYNNGSHRLRSWIFEASADGEDGSWRTLRTHVNAMVEIADEAFPTASWSIQVPGWELPLPTRPYLEPAPGAKVKATRLGAAAAAAAAGGRGRASGSAPLALPVPAQGRRRRVASMAERRRQLEVRKRKMLERYDDDPSFAVTAARAAEASGQRARTRAEYAAVLELEAESSLLHAQPWARYFRIRMTDLNSSDRDVLTISGIELWGELRAPKLVSTARRKTKRGGVPAS